MNNLADPKFAISPGYTYADKKVIYILILAGKE